jgi:hypothetical protein
MRIGARRRSVAGLVLAAALPGINALPAAASPRRPIVALPPYARTLAVSGIHLYRDCVIGQTPLPDVRPDATTGVVDHSRSAAVDGCEDYGGGAVDTWRIAVLPPGIAGTAGTVLLLVRVDEERFVTGPGSTTGYAYGALAIAGSSFPTMRVSCTEGRCTTSTLPTLPGSRYAILRTPTASLPQELDLSIHRGFDITGTGAVGIEFRGALVGVVVVPGTGVHSEALGETMLRKLMTQERPRHLATGIPFHVGERQ